MNAKLFTIKKETQIANGNDKCVCIRVFSSECK